MADFIRNLEQSKVLSLAGQVDVAKGQVVSKTLAQNDAVSLTIFAFDAGEEISSHASEGDALVTVLEGKGRITIGGEMYMLQAGQSIVMPAGVPHALLAVEPFKMFLTVIF
ncbi:MAG: cupin domain-containing protein [Ruminococcaceae bacterium]|nr:cupin domain-containing protein [Oscillospiraceae bacterium]